MDGKMHVAELRRLLPMPCFDCEHRLHEYEKIPGMRKLVRSQRKGMDRKMHVAGELQRLPPMPCFEDTMQKVVRRPQATLGDQMHVVVGLRRLLRMPRSKESCQI